MTTDTGGSEATSVRDAPADVEATAVPDAVVDPRLILREQGVRGYLEVARRRIRGGELGPLPVVIGILVIWTVFQLQEPRFLSAQNLTNLVVQASAVGTISVGIVLVLLLGEIDLSVGSVSGLAGAVVAVLNVQQGLPVWLSILLAALTGTAVGLLQGGIRVVFNVPAFVVSLSGLLGWQGLQLYVLGKEGTINLPFDGGIAALTNTYFPAWFGYVLLVVVTGVYLVSGMTGRARRRAAGLTAPPLPELLLRASLLAGLLLAAVLVFNGDRGTPLAFLIFLTFVVLFDLGLRRTRYGRMIFAVGGNAEAARRAGVNVGLVRLSVFTICSTMAAVGGVLAASRIIAASQSSGGGDTLLFAIAAAVIGGTSLYGGRGSAYSALFGILVIWSISNGMDLLGLDASVKFMITGAVLITAVIVDAVARRGRVATGRA